MYAPQVEVSTVSLTTVKITLPEFNLEIDGDPENGYEGLFLGESHDITFRGPTPDHVIGVANRYCLQLTRGKPFNLFVEIDDDEVLAELAPLP
jgi:hypothetical protein